MSRFECSFRPKAFITPTIVELHLVGIIPGLLERNFVSSEDEFATIHSRKFSPLT
jgi:hypothetical protein